MTYHHTDMETTAPTVSTRWRKNKPHEAHSWTIAVRIDASRHAVAKLYAVEHGRTLTDVVRAALEAYCNGVAPAQADAKEAVYGAVRAADGALRTVFVHVSREQKMAVKATALARGLTLSTVVDAALSAYIDGGLHATDSTPTT